MTATPSFRPASSLVKLYADSQWRLSPQILFESLTASRCATLAPEYTLIVFTAAAEDPSVMHSLARRMCAPAGLPSNRDQSADAYTLPAFLPIYPLPSFCPRSHYLYLTRPGSSLTLGP